MWINAELVVKNYKPLHLEIGMFFMNVLMKGTKKEHVEIYKLDKYPLDQDEFISKNGYPVEFYIITEDDEILATPDEIGWFDAGDESDELYDITLKEINTIIQEYDGYLMVDMEEIHEDDETDDYIEMYPVKYLDKITIRYPFEEEEEEYDEEDEKYENHWDEDEMDDDTWKTE